MSSLTRVRTGLFLAQLACVLMVLGGLGDQLVRELLPAHASMLGMPLALVPPRVAQLVLALLHALGFALIAVGLAALALLRQTRATGPLRLVGPACGTALLAEGANAYFMYQLRQPLFVVPLAIAGLFVAGGLLAVATPTARQQ